MRQVAIRPTIDSQIRVYNCGMQSVFERNDLFHHIEALMPRTGVECHEKVWNRHLSTTRPVHPVLLNHEQPITANLQQNTWLYHNINDQKPENLAANKFAWSSGQINIEKVTCT